MLTMQKLESFINANIDFLYENRNKNVINLLLDADDPAQILKNPEFYHLQ